MQVLCDLWDLRKKGLGLRPLGLFKAFAEGGGAWLEGSKALGWGTLSLPGRED